MWLTDPYRRTCGAAHLPWTEISLALTLWPPLGLPNPPWHHQSPSPRLLLILWEVYTRPQHPGAPRKGFFKYFTLAMIMSNLIRLFLCALCAFYGQICEYLQKVRATTGDITKAQICDLQTPFRRYIPSPFVFLGCPCNPQVPCWPLTVGYISGLKDIPVLFLFFVLLISAKPNVSITFLPPCSWSNPSPCAPPPHSLPLRWRAARSYGRRRGKVWHFFWGCLPMPGPLFSFLRGCRMERGFLTCAAVCFSSVLWLEPY